MEEIKLLITIIEKQDDKIELLTKAINSQQKLNISNLKIREVVANKLVEISTRLNNLKDIDGEIQKLELKIDKIDENVKDLERNYYSD